METNSSNQIEILHDFSPLARIYKDGRIERFSGEDFLPPTIDPDTGVESQDVNISSQPDVSARLYLPKNDGQTKLPLLVYFHGGGFIIETAFSATYHKHMNSLASEANVVIVSVNYRRAPEHRLPAAYEDCWSAIKWVSSNSIHHSWLKHYADFNKVYFGGDSAGGNLAYQMALKMGTENVEGLNLVGIFLNCPYFWGKELIGKEGLKPEWKKMLDNLSSFLYPNTTRLDDPLLNPATDPKLSSLRCKRVLVIVGEKDVLRDRGWHFKDVLTKTTWDGEIEVVEFEGEDHVFYLFNPNTENAISAMKILVSFLNQDGA